ncbi:MAG: Uma2 family endonuclease [Acidobacteria bacterium]|nr:Uma2 family endonuclease [Acidobacteriota bacterium]
MSIEALRWQFTVADFARMVQAGILSEDDNVELMDGEVRAMSPVGPRHVAIVNRLNAILSSQIAGRAIVSVQNPIQLTDYTEPQPDIAVLCPREDFYAHALPLPEDVLLVVEVAEASLEYDRGEKVPRYAQMRIPEVWLVDVERETVTQYTNSDGSRYAGEQTLARGQHLDSPNTLGALRLSIDAIFGNFDPVSMST